MTAFPLSKAFGLLEPGPVILLSTSRGGRSNVMTVSWHTVMDFTPRIGCVLDPADYSFGILRETRECVISIPAVDIIETVVDIGNCSGSDTDKFAAFGLTPVAAECVKAPLVAECIAHIECRVVDDGMADAYGLFVLEGVKAWVDGSKSERRTFHANGDGTFVVDGEIRDLKERMVKWPEFL